MSFGVHHKSSLVNSILGKRIPHIVPTYAGISLCTLNAGKLSLVPDKSDAVATEKQNRLVKTTSENYPQKNLGSFGK